MDELKFLKDMEKRLFDLTTMIEQIDVRGQKSVWAAYNVFGMIQDMAKIVQDRAEIEELNSEKPVKNEIQKG